MHVSDYSYISNAAQLGALGYLADDRDVSRRRTPLKRLDDQALFYEGVMERYDLLEGTTNTMALPVYESIRGYDSARTYYNSIVSQWTEYGVVNVLPFLPRHRSIKSFAHIGAGSVSDAVDTALGGARAPRAQLSRNDYTLNTPMWQFVKDASDRLYDFYVFRKEVSPDGYCGAFEANVAITPDGTGQDFGDSMPYYYLWERDQQGVSERTRSASFTITVTKSANTLTPLSSNKYAALAAVVTSNLWLSWFNVETGEGANASGTGYAIVALQRSSTSFTYSGSIGPNNQRLAIRSAFGSPPTMTGRGVIEEWASNPVVSHLVVLTSPTATSAFKFAS